ncbi:MAG TPA: hypothetical protein GXX59_02915 [Syntrophomonadaceae bacterium]|nr:hypothetical protein [Syntrophomonadaceae bacterium]
MAGIYGLVDHVNSSANTPADNRDARLKEACQEFEALFWMQILKSARSSIPGGGLFGESSEREHYTSLLDLQYSLILAKQDAGVGRMLYEQLRSRV